MPATSRFRASSVKLVIPTVALGLTLGTRAALAVFVGGVEHFDGTIKDTVTWEEYRSNGEVISQNDALTIADPNGFGSKSGDYTTRQLALLPGSAVSAKVTINSPGMETDVPGIASLFLTNDSRGTTDNTFFDSYWAQLQFNLGPQQGEIWRWIGGNGGSNQWGDLGLVSNPVGQTFKFEIERPNNTDYIFRAYDAQDTLLGSNTYLGSTPHPEGLFISLLGINGSTATWDDVTVNGNVTPEPASLAALAGLGLLLRRPNRKRSELV